MVSKRTISLIAALVIAFAAMIPVSADAQAITVGTVTVAGAEPGDTVEVEVRISGNPGIWGMDLKISWDTSALKLTAVSNGGFFADSEWTPGDLEAPYYILSYAANGFNDITTPSGLLATLTFTVLDGVGAGETYPVIASCDGKNQIIINSNFDELDFEIISGSVIFEPADSVSYGDLNGDGAIDTVDLTLLRQYLADNSTEVDQAAADTDGSGTVDTVDLTLLRQYLADNSVALGPQS